MSELLNVLIVEDMKEDAILVIRELRHSGFNPIWERVQTAEELRTALVSRTWNVIISDYCLPRFSAPAALEVVTQSGQDIPFIVVSGTIGEESAVEMMKAGAHDYVMKDNLKRLPEAVRREIREARMRAERQQAQTTLDRTQERLQLAIEGSGIGLWDWYVQQQTIIFNEHWAEMIGYTLQELEPIGSPTWMDFLHPDDVRKSYEALERHFRQETPVYECEVRMRHRSGEWVWVLARGKVVERDGSGKPVRMLGTHLDVTERKRAETALQNLIEGTASVTGANFFSALVKHIAMALNVAYVLVSERIGDRLQTLAFWGEGELQDNTSYGIPQTPCERVLEAGCYACLHAIQTIFPDNQDLVEMQAESYLGIALRDANGKALGNLCILDTCPLTDLDRTEAILRVFAARAGAELERQRAINALHQMNRELEDIVQQRTAELRQSNEQLATTNLELARATRLKDEFLANMSHELRTPLNAILGLSESLQEQIFGPVNERQQKAISMVEQSGQHLLSLINDILDLSKIGSGKLELYPTSVSVEHLCESSLVFVRQQALQKDIQLVSQIPTDLQDIVVDELRMRQALINLLTNAVKFTPEGGQVTFKVSQASGSEPGPVKLVNPRSPGLVFTVEDTGIGIASENLDRLFKPFVQIDSSLNRQYTGTGLGLALVKQITELHGGWVGVESRLGQGSQFTITLPSQVLGVRSSSLGQPIYEAPESLSFSSNELQAAAMPPLILLAEDNEANIDMFTTYLMAQGYRLLLAKDGQQAIALSAAQKPDVILMDVQLPGTDGLEATRQIRSNGQLNHIPIIALTALAMPGDQERCMAAGVDAYLAKPVKMKQLVAVIQQLLNQESL
ncbi:hypothetical protein BST81_16130 [Leptolyngbya sp. 'hensonii']|uniref:response regulator n=1 Tax=Leptolyngbya sp. 'hensonii' TaxID=1922337 RepID=UPI00094F4A6F|nr:response regulator [Leptolyngbya sp. 'hensonii']OLP17332.1 hypothetical protein BST81_16130 [Leptolyngbya sp. 'hensonii']